MGILAMQHGMVILQLAPQHGMASARNEAAYTQQRDSRWRALSRYAMIPIECAGKYRCELDSGFVGNKTARESVMESKLSNREMRVQFATVTSRTTVSTFGNLLSNHRHEFRSVAELESSP